MVRCAVLVAVVLLGFPAACSRALGEGGVSYQQVLKTIRDGDVIFQESRSAQSEAIRAATNSRYTHIAIVFGATTDAPYVIEAVQPVRQTPLKQWILRGAEAHFVLMRLRDETPLDVSALRRSAEAFVGMNYDGKFDWSDARIYCSELVWKAYDRALHIHLGEPQQWSALRLHDNAAKQLALKRLGHLPDPTALVVTPARIMESDLLVRVLEGKLAE